MIQRVICLSSLLSNQGVLTRRSVRRSRFAIGLQTSVRVFLTFVGRDGVFARVERADFRFIRLSHAESQVLARAFRGRIVFLAYRLGVFFYFRRFFLYGRIFFVRLFLLIVDAAMTYRISVRLYFFRLVIRFILFRHRLYVAGGILLFHRLYLDVRSLRIRV